MRPEKGPRRNRREQSPPRRSRRWVAAGAVILLAAAGLIYARMTVQSRPTKPNVVLILIDALRPDRLHCYGYERRTSPNLDALAADGAMFTDAMAQAPETLVSTPSLFTGRYPQEHGMQWMERGPDIFIGPHLGLPSIAELLRGAGYETAAVSGSPIIGPGLGFDRGFDHFDQSRGLISNSQGMNAGDLNVAVSEWLDQRDTRRPFFLYIHYLDPHHAYHPPREFAVFGTGAYTPQDQQLNVKVHQLAGQYKNTGITDAALAGAGLSRADVGRLSDLYDGEVLCVDHYVGELVRRLKDDGLYDHTIIIVTADHGQAFLEHGNLKHGGSLYQVLLRVPLIVRRPASRRGERIGGLVQEVDIAPTILQAVGAHARAKLSGRSFLDMLAGKRLQGDEYGLALLPSARQYAVRQGPLKLISTPAGDELYDLSKDSDETTNLKDSRPDEVKSLRGVLHRLLQQYPPAKGATSRATEQDRDALRSLGYIR